MKNKKIKNIVLMSVGCIFVFTFLFSICSSSYRIERLKLFSNSTISKVINNV